MFKVRTNKPAFTLTELLVVIAIIGIISTLAVVSLTNARQSARDAKRIADIKQIQTSLELYYQDNNKYPATITDSIATSGITYMQTYPTAPTPADGNCSDSDNTYTYTVSGTENSSYSLTFCLGNKTNDLDAGVKEAIPGGIIAYSPPSQCGEYNVTFTYNGSSVTYGTVLNSTTGECWLDRNLGATQVATASNDANAYGHLFQWGRGADGHQIRNSGTTVTLSGSDTPGHANFILATNSPYDWRNPQNIDLWQGVSGINNPCPIGWRIPTEAEWEAERSSWSSNNSAGAFASPLKLTLAGSRFTLVNGALFNVGSIGYYWAGSVNGSISRFLNFNSSDVSMSSVDRAYGLTVRCLKN